MPSRLHCALRFSSLHYHLSTIPMLVNTTWKANGFVDIYTDAWNVKSQGILSLANLQSCYISSFMLFALTPKLTLGCVWLNDEASTPTAVADTASGEVAIDLSRCWSLSSRPGTCHPWPYRARAKVSLGEIMAPGIWKAIVGSLVVYGWRQGRIHPRVFFVSLSVASLTPMNEAI